MLNLLTVEEVVERIKTADSEASAADAATSPRLRPESQPHRSEFSDSENVGIEDAGAFGNQFFGELIQWSSRNTRRRFSPFRDDSELTTGSRL